VALEILSGDRPAAVERIGGGLGLPGRGGLLPAQKVERLEAARARGEVVAMVGDGLNDGPVLAAADLGIAVGSASELARRSGNVRLLGDSIERLAQLLVVARRTRRVITANLLFAFTFNGIGLYLAAAGRLSPVFAALAMALSSLLVVRISTAAAEGPRTERPSTVPGRPLDWAGATP
jgi:P-type E1-E2 ATPase